MNFLKAVYIFSLFSFISILKKPYLYIYELQNIELEKNRFNILNLQFLTSIKPITIINI
jgi:hypothetical protein